MNFRKIRYKLRKSFTQRGLLATAAAAMRAGLRPTARLFDKPKTYAAIHPFDQEFDVDTSGLLFPEDLASSKNKDLSNAGYFGVAPSVLRQIFDQVALDFTRFTFVDLGSGKGRALLIASEYAFRSIVGVELSPALHAIAQSNIVRFRGPAQRCRNIHAIEADATEFFFPPGPLLVYLWNPFELPVFTKVLANLEASLVRDPRECCVVYIQPDLEDLLEASERWRRLWRKEFTLDDKDYAAHAFPSRIEVCSVYTPADRG